MTQAEAEAIVFYWDGTAIHHKNFEQRRKLWIILDALAGWRPASEAFPFLDEMIEGGKGSEKVRGQVKEIRKLLLGMERQKAGKVGV